MVDINKDLADYAIKQAIKLGAGYADARLEYSQGEGFALKNGTPEVSGFGDSSGIGLRVLVGNSMSFASTNYLTKSKINDLVLSAIKTAKASQRLIKSKRKLANSPSYSNKSIISQKIKLADIGADKKLSALTDIHKSLASGKAEVTSDYLALSTGVIQRYITTSEGSKIFSETPRVGFYYVITVKHGSETAQRYLEYKAVQGWEAWNKWNVPEVLGAEALMLRDNMKSGISAPKGAIDIVAAPEVVGIAVHESCGHPYEADRILGREAAQAGESFVTPKMLGSRIGSSVVNLVDDPTVPNSAGFYLFDDEGVKARRKLLIKEGNINEFLHNRETAGQLGVKSNGSARIEMYANEPIVRMSNTFMLPGNHSKEELIEGVKLGVYLKSFMEWNIDDKRYNQKYVGSEAYLIKNGKIGKPIKKPALELTTPKFYSSIDAVGKKVEYIAGTCGKGEPMQGVPVWMGGPHIRLRGIKLN